MSMVTPVASPTARASLLNQYATYARTQQIAQQALAPTGQPTPTPTVKDDSSSTASAGLSTAQGGTQNEQAQTSASAAAAAQAAQMKAIQDQLAAQQKQYIDLQKAQLAGQNAAGQVGGGGSGAPFVMNGKGVYNVADPAKGGGYSQASWGGASNLSAARNQALSTAFSYVGDAYKLGGTSHAGIDCSGLVMAVYDQFGFGKYVDNHYVPTQMAQIPGTRTAVSNLVPGDIVAWKDGSHIAIYAGNGQIVAAAAPGEGVKYQPVWGDVVGIHINLPGD